jgi:hypothetical protein
LVKTPKLGLGSSCSSSPSRRRRLYQSDRVADSVSYKPSYLCLVRVLV